jgi:hypothetical protein
MPDITAISISIYNDSASQNDTIASLTAYIVGKNISKKKIPLFVFFFPIEFLTQYETAYVEECSPTEPASKLPTSHSCIFSWTDIVTSDSI